MVGGVFCLATVSLVISFLQAHFTSCARSCLIFKHSVANQLGNYSFSNGTLLSREHWRLMYVCMSETPHQLQDHGWWMGLLANTQAPAFAQNLCVGTFHFDKAFSESKAQYYSCYFTVETCKQHKMSWINENKKRFSLSANEVKHII